jgi:FkbM family methyltransferase
MQSVTRLLEDLQAVRRHADRRTFFRYLNSVALSFPQIVRTRTLVPADERMRGWPCTFKPIHGDIVSLDGKHFSGAREMYCRRVYFRVAGFEIRDGDVVIDVGANRGLFTTMAAVYGERVVAIEAQSSFLPLIHENLERNRCRDRAVVEIALVGDPSGLLHTSEARTSSRVWESRPAVVPMADIFRQHDVNRVSLMKIDIEGSEFSLISPEAQWLWSVDRIVMEVHCDFGNVAQLQRVLEDFGFATTLTNAHRATPVDRITGSGGYLYAFRAK